MAIRMISFVRNTLFQSIICLCLLTACEAGDERATATDEGSTATQPTDASLEMPTSTHVEGQDRQTETAEVEVIETLAPSILIQEPLEPTVASVEDSSTPTVSTQHSDGNVNASGVNIAVAFRVQQTFNTTLRLFLAAGDLLDLGMDSRLGDATSIHTPDWSPDGNEILISVLLPVHLDQRDIYVDHLAIYNIMSDELSILQVDITGGMNQGFGKWSPDGSQIVFEQSGGEYDYIWIINRDGSEPRLVAQGSQPDWSPDNRAIVFQRNMPNSTPDCRSCSLSEVWLVDVYGNGERLLIESEWSPEEPAWSPDGEYIAFRGRHSSAVSTDDGIFLYTVETGTMREIATFGQHPCWLPNGDGILVIDNENQVYAISDNGDAMLMMSLENSFGEALYGAAN